MNVLASECSSRCESGWTLYLEQSFVSPNASHKSNEFVNRKSYCDDYEEEDLSMVSDASSGPPNLHEYEANYFHEDHNSSFCPASKNVKLLKNGGRKRQKVKQRKCSVEQEDQSSSLLDDTASSPLFNLSMHKGFTLANNNQASLDSVLDFSQGFSATHFKKGRSAFQDSVGFFQSSLSSANQLQENQSSSDGWLSRNCCWFLKVNYGIGSPMRSFSSFSFILLPDNAVSNKAAKRCWK